MTEAYGESPYYTEEEYRSIARIATEQGAIGGAKINMTELLDKFFRMQQQDAFGMTMLHDDFCAVNSSNYVSSFPEASRDIEAEALDMANRAVEIMQNGGEDDADFYIGSGTPVHTRAKEFLPLVQKQRGIA
jgi:hypothetical protein